MSDYEFDAIGTRWWIHVLSSEALSTSICEKINDTITTFDQRYSRFRDDSLIMELYNTGKIVNPPEELIEMLKFAKQMYDDSAGAFDISVGDDLHRLGYGKRSLARNVAPQNFWKMATINVDSISCTYGPILDLGGFGKGWLIDKLVRLMRRNGYTEFIINGGGDLYVQAESPQEIVLADPRSPSTVLTNIYVKNAALAGSDTLKRSWRYGKKTKHHIIDPATHDSSSGKVIASYVSAPSALIADAMATILILRPELTEKLVEKYELKSILISHLDSNYQPNSSMNILSVGTASDSSAA